MTRLWVNCRNNTNCLRCLNACKSSLLHVHLLTSKDPSAAQLTQLHSIPKLFTIYKRSKLLHVCDEYQCLDVNFRLDEQVHSACIDLLQFNADVMPENGAECHSGRDSVWRFDD